MSRLIARPSRRVSVRTPAVHSPVHHALALAALAVCTSPAWAQTTVELERVEVSGTPLSGSKLRRDQIAAPVQNATAEDLQRSGALRREGEVLLAR